MNTTPHSQGLGQLIASASGGVPDRIELMPVGRVQLRDARWERELRVDDPQAVIAASFANVAGGMLPIDFAHSLDGLGDKGDGRAAGWITKMDVEGGKIVAAVEWTKAGREALENKDYRFISPVFFHDKNGPTIRRISRAGLVNVPAIHDLAQVASHQETTMDEFLVEIRQALGLPDDAEGDKIVAAAKGVIDASAASEKIVVAAGQTGPLTEAIATGVVAKITAGAQTAAPDPAKYAPMEIVTELTKRVASLQQTQTSGAVEMVIASAMTQGKISPAMRDWATGYATADLPGFKKYLEGAPVICAGASGELLPALKPAETGKLTAEEKQVCAAFSLDEDAFIATRDGKPLPAKKEG